MLVQRWAPREMMEGRFWEVGVLGVGVSGFSLVWLCVILFVWDGEVYG